MTTERILNGVTILILLCTTGYESVYGAEFSLKDANSSNSQKESMIFSDEFSGDKLSARWKANLAAKTTPPKPTNGTLLFPASGKNIDTCSRLLIITSEEKYEAETELTVRDGAIAGLTLYFPDAGFASLSLNANGGLERKFQAGKTRLKSKIPLRAEKIRLKIVNKDGLIFFYFDVGANQWNEFGKPLRLPKAKGNRLESHPAIFVAGSGFAEFEFFRCKIIK